MGMTNNDALFVELLRGSVIVLVSVDKGTRRKIADSHFNLEVLIRLDGGTIRGTDELGRGHIFGGRNDTHRCGIARPTGNLIAIGKRRARNGQTEVDKIVGGSQGRGLTCKDII